MGRESEISRIRFRLNCFCSSLVYTVPRIVHRARASFAVNAKFPPWLAALAIVSALSGPSSFAAQVQHLNTQSAAASGAGASGIPSLASFSIPSGKNRVLFIWASFERDHCSNADVTGGLCTQGNTAGTGLGDNYPEPRTGTPPATTTNIQLTARVVGPGGTIDKRNALVIGGTPSGDTRFTRISTSPTGSPAGTAFFSLDGFHIVLFENEINTLLAGAASGTVSISLPDTFAPSNAGDEAVLVASVFQNVEQTVAAVVRNATATAQVSTGTPGNSTLAPVAYDAGQAPSSADDGKLVLGISSSTEWFVRPAGHTELVVRTVTNGLGNYDTPAGNTNNEPNGMSAGMYFRNGGATPGSLYSLQLGGAAATLIFGGTSASFLLKADNADVGDAPISYGDASHAISGIRLGNTVDADPLLLNGSNATGDDLNGSDDEDGVTLPASFPVGSTVVVPVNIQNASGVLNVWIDWNADGDFNDPGEQMVSDQPVAVGNYNLNIAVPTNAAIGTTFARFRVCASSAATAPLDNCNTPVRTVQSGEVEDYAIQISRWLILRKTTVGGFGGPFQFTLTNTFQASGTVTTTAANSPTQVDGDINAAGTQVFSIASSTSAVTIDESSLPPGWVLSGATCVNAASVTVGSLNGSTYTISGPEIVASSGFTCTFNGSKLPTLRLQKALPAGRLLASDQFTLSITGPGGPASATTTGTGTTAAGVATLSAGGIGATYVLSETGAASANLAGYSSTYVCTNALSGGQTPSGIGTVFVLTAVTGDDLTCTFTNVPPQSDLRLTLTNTPGANGEVDQAADTLVAGGSSAYRITVTNLGPDAANGAIVTSPSPTGLTCSTASCTPSGGATCPAPTGAALVAALQGAGATFPALPNGGSAAIVLTCSVSGTGNAAINATVAPAIAGVDPDLSNNAAADNDAIVFQSNLSLGMVDSPDPVPINQTLTYTLTVSNAGPSPVPSSSTLSIVESLPAGLSGCSFTPSAGTFNAGSIASGVMGTGTWAGVSIASGGSATLSIACTANSAAALSNLSNTATVIPPAGTSDPDCSGSPVSCVGGNTASVSTVLIGPILNIDNSDAASTYDAATDGVLLLRYLLGYRGSALIADARGNGASLRDAAQIESHILAALTLLDVDGDGQTLAVTDGLMILRRLLNPTALLTDAAAMSAITANAKRGVRTDAQVVSRIDALKP